MAARYEVPPGLLLSPECQDLLSRMLVVAPQHRITIPSIMRHPFFLRNLPRELLVAPLQTHTHAHVHVHCVLHR